MIIVDIPDELNTWRETGRRVYTSDADLDRVPGDLIHMSVFVVVDDPTRVPTILERWSVLIGQMALIRIVQPHGEALRA